MGTKKDPSKKAVKPIFKSEGGSTTSALEALQVQELMTVDEDGDPVMQKIVVDSAVVMQGENQEPPFYAFIKKLHWDSKSKKAKVSVCPLVRASAVDSDTERDVNSNIRTPSLVFLSTESQTVPAWRIMHPCRVFFLQASEHPPAMLKLNGKKQEGIRFGLICCSIYDKSNLEYRPFHKLKSGDQFFTEVQRLLQKTNRELRALEAKEEVPVKKRTAPLSGQFAAFNLGGGAPPQVGSRLTQHVSLTRNKSVDGKKAQSQPKSDLLKRKRGDSLLTGEASSRETSVAKRDDDVSTSGQSTSKGATQTEGDRTESMSYQDTVAEDSEEEVEAKRRRVARDESNQVANDLAMTLELEGFGDAAFRNVSVSIKKLLLSAGPLAQPCTEQKKISVLQLHAWRQLIAMPEPQIVKRLALAANAAPQETREKLAQEGFYRLIGTYLHGTLIPPAPADPPVSILPLLKAMSLAVPVEGWSTWLVLNRMLTHLDALEDSPHASIQQAAKNVKGTLLEAASQAEAFNAGVASLAVDTKKEESLMDTKDLGFQAPDSSMDQPQLFGDVPSEQFPQKSGGSKGLSRLRNVTRAEPRELTAEKLSEPDSPAIASKRMKGLQAEAVPRRQTRSSKSPSVQLEPEMNLPTGGNGRSKTHPQSATAQTKKSSFPKPSGSKTKPQNMRNVAEVTREAPRVAKGRGPGDAEELAKRGFEAAARAKLALAIPSPPLSVATTGPTPSRDIDNLMQQEPGSAREKTVMSTQKGTHPVEIDTFEPDHATTFPPSSATISKEQGLTEEDPKPETSLIDLVSNTASLQQTSDLHEEVQSKSQKSESSASPHSLLAGKQKLVEKVSGPVVVSEKDVGSGKEEGKESDDEELDFGVHKARGKAKSPTEINCEGPTNAEYTQKVLIEKQHGKSAMYGRLNLGNMKVLLEEGLTGVPTDVVSLDEFAVRAGKRTKWQKHVYIEDCHGTANELLATWMESKCLVCERPDNDQVMLECENEGCERHYHTYCLQPPLSKVPSGQWFCPECVEGQN